MTLFKGKKIRLRFIIILLTPVLLAGGFLVYRWKNPTHGKLSSDTVSGERELTGVIIRNEKVAEVSDYAAIRYLIQEGEQVSDGSAIAVLYSKGYDSQLSEIVAQSEKVYSQQITLLKLMNETGEIPPEVLSFNAKIDETVEKMTQAAMADRGDYLALSSELRVLLEDRENFLKSVIPDESVDSALSANYQILDSLRNSFALESDLMNHSGEGFISFHLDGYETALEVNSLTASQARKIVSSPLAGTIGANALYRVIDPNGFYIALTVASNDAFRFIVGEKYDLKVRHQNTVYTGRVISEKFSGSYVLYVLQIDADAQPVLENRTIEVSVSSTASGTSIPVEGLFFNNGVPYVYIYTGTSYEPVAVEILSADEDNAVIRAVNTKIQLHSGIKFEYHEEEDE